MANSRSFTEYVANTFSNQFWAAAEEYLQQNWDPDEYDFYKIRRPGEPELDDVKVEHVWLFDRPGMYIQFDVAVSLHLIIPDDDHHYDEYEEWDKWLMIRCEVDLDKELEDMNIFEVSEYNGKTGRRTPWTIHLFRLSEKTSLTILRRYFFAVIIKITPGAMLGRPCRTCKEYGIEYPQAADNRRWYCFRPQFLPGMR